MLKETKPITHKNTIKMMKMNTCSHMISKQIFKEIVMAEELLIVKVHKMLAIRNHELRAQE
jgi:hypothetical protein